MFGGGVYSDLLSAPALLAPRAIRPGARAAHRNRSYPRIGEPRKGPLCRGEHARRRLRHRGSFKWRAGTTSLKSRARSVDLGTPPPRWWSPRRRSAYTARLSERSGKRPEPGPRRKASADNVFPNGLVAVCCADQFGARRRAARGGTARSGELRPLPRRRRHLF
jgi:hypothetical protein